MSTAVLFGGIAVFIIILVIFIIWKIKCDNATSSSGGRTSGQLRPRLQGRSANPMGREAAVRTDEQNVDYQYIDLNSNTASPTADNSGNQNGRKSGGLDSKPLTTTFIYQIAVSQLHGGENQRGTTATAEIPTAPPASEADTKAAGDVSGPGPIVTVITVGDATSATRPDSYSRLGDSAPPPLAQDQGPEYDSPQAARPQDQGPEYDNPPTARQATHARPGSDFGQPGNNTGQGSESQSPRLYALASPIDKDVHAGGGNTQGDKEGRTSAGSGDYFILESAESPSADTGERGDHFVQEPQYQGDGAGVGGTSSDNVYVQLEDGK